MHQHPSWSPGGGRPGDNKAAISKAGATPLLVALLQSSSHKVQEAAAGALMNLAISNADNKAAIAKAGAIPPLMVLLQSSCQGLQQHVAGALWSLAGRDDDDTGPPSPRHVPPPRW